MFPLLKYFSIMSAIVIGLATILMTSSFYNHEMNQVVANGEKQNIRVARLLANAVEHEIVAVVNLPAGIKIDNTSLANRIVVQQLHAKLASIISGIPVLKVKLYDLNGLTVYSSLYSQISDSKESNQGFITAVDEDKPTSKLSHRKEFYSFDGLLYNRQVVETYLPVRFANGELGAVFELYFDVTLDYAAVKKESLFAIVIMLLAFTIIYGGMLLIVRRADGNLRQQYVQIKQNEKDAKLQNATLENEVSSRKKVQQALQDAHDTMEEKVEERTRDLGLVSMAVEQSHSSVVVSGIDGIIEYVNPMFAKTTGYDEKEIIGESTAILRSESTSNSVYQEIEKVIRSGDQWQGEILGCKKSGEEYWGAVSVSPIFDKLGVVTHIVSVMEDITLRREYEERLLKQANYDDLTGLANRVLVRDRVVEAIKEADRNHKKLAIMLIDLDDFKKVNDTLGHATGDKLLIEVARRISNCIRNTDTLARNGKTDNLNLLGRLGGDEFFILLPNLSDASQVERIAKAALTVVEAPFYMSSNELFISASIGIAIYPDDTKSVDELFSCADLAMYKAKDDGRGRFRYFTKSLNEKAMTRLHIENELRSSLEREEFELNYQPIVSAKDGCLVGAEALLRWTNKKLGKVSPEDFIPVAESTGLIISIGEWVLNQAMADAAVFSKKIESDFYITVNVSARQLRDPSLLLAFKEAYARHDLSSSCIKVEITESMILDEYGDTDKNLVGLGDLGARLVIDDFGTGFSSLRNLTRVPTETVKIDKSFVLGCLESAQDADMVRAVIAMAHGLDIQVVAEGVETQGILDFLKAADCDLIQGWHTGRPIPANEFIIKHLNQDA